MKYSVEYLWAGEWTGHVETYTYEEAVAYMVRMPQDRWPIRIRRGNELVSVQQIDQTDADILHAIGWNTPSAQSSPQEVKE